MPEMRVEEEYMDVLQNIEFGIVSTYHEHPELLDYDVVRALEAVVDSYKAEQIGRAPRDFPLSQIEKKLFGAVRAMCEWRLGRGGPIGYDSDDAPEPKTVDEILLCLKRILKSVETWNRSGGRQGYLNFVSQYVH